ncbi:DUF2007 domain-containing protein [uncultured Chryseobacterium sp.]|uniref:DUF2007 domain-containing protein n=1 Tax=uncultured Chryseobacterium sp. TaxID=259322 RepID=UPI00261544FF|nr:DUF2007 domain-containing protein [uncultured Chryseobacterium sp.]
MERQTRVAVFESDNPSEIQIIKAKLDEAKIGNITENSYMTFTTTPTATSLKLKVSLADEKKAFEIIDSYLQGKEEFNQEKNTIS